MLLQEWIQLEKNGKIQLVEHVALAPKVKY
jgi:hypothetical protein